MSQTQGEDTAKQMALKLGPVLTGTDALDIARMGQGSMGEEEGFNQCMACILF